MHCQALQVNLRLASCFLLVYAMTGCTEGQLEVEESGYMVLGHGEQILLGGGASALWT